jgi:ribose 5-phosphate isomerase RpiB
MSANGRHSESNGNGAALHWPGRVVTAEALQRGLHGHREILVPPAAVITPLAEEQLRAGGVRVTRQAPTQQTNRLATWGYTHDVAHPLIDSAVQSLAREGIALEALPRLHQDEVGDWAKQVAACVGAGQCCGSVVFCGDPGLFCCVVNKVPGLRAVPVVTVFQAARATLTVGANVLAVEMPGRTFFEIRQILRALCNGCGPCCPPGIACTLRELDGHAHS